MRRRPSRIGAGEIRAVAAVPTTWGEDRRGLSSYVLRSPERMAPCQSAANRAENSRGAR